MKKCHCILVICIYIYTTYLDFLTLAHVFGDGTVVPHPSMVLEQSDLEIVYEDSELPLWPDCCVWTMDHGQCLNWQKGISSTCFKTAASNDILERSWIWTLLMYNLVIFIVERQASCHFTLDVSKFLHMLKNVHDNSHSYCVNPQLNYWGKEVSK